ncbi:hypothetical protein EMIT0111MI5_110101 [Burkholderia sp. IT-111MI5]
MSFISLKKRSNLSVGRQRAEWVNCVRFNMDIL